MPPKYVNGDVVITCKVNEYGDRTVYYRPGKTFEPVTGFANNSFTITDSIFIEEENQWYYKKVNDYYVAEVCLTLDFLETAKKRYPVGTIFEPAHVRNGYCVITANNHSMEGHVGNVYSRTDTGLTSSSYEERKHGDNGWERVLYDASLCRWAKILSMNVILERAKKDFPVNSKFICIHTKRVVKITENHVIKLDTDDCIRVYGKAGTDVSCLYSHTTFEWAKETNESESIVDSPEPITTTDMSNSKFKIGDKVIGNEDADINYGITKKGWKGVVIDIEGSHFKAKAFEEGQEYGDLHQDHFDLLVESVPNLHTFKLGDLVIGNNPIRYTVTKKGWIGRVVKLWEDGTLSVKELDGNSKYEVEPKYFDLYEENKKETSSSSKFKVGDKVIGNKKASEAYTVTREGWIGEVIEIKEKYFKAVGAEGDFSLCYGCFDHYIPESSHLITPDQYYQPIIKQPKEEGSIIVLPLQKAIIF